MIQIGNNGSPLETSEGWLVLTHGVGPMRKYCIGCMLLDLDDPSKIIGQLPNPLLSPNTDEREGYVPNVVYTCGAMIHRGELIIPYAMSDSVSGIATVSVDEVLAGMRYRSHRMSRCRHLQASPIRGIWCTYSCSEYSCFRSRIK